MRKVLIVETSLGPDEENEDYPRNGKPHGVAGTEVSLGTASQCSVVSREEVQLPAEKRPPYDLGSPLAFLSLWPHNQWSG